MKSPRSNWPHVLCITLIAGVGHSLRALAADDPESAQLEILVRQLDALDRSAEYSARLPPAKARYHFDYARLHADVQRIRSGLRDYLTPQRAQPRDVTEIGGGYTVEPPEAGP